MQGTADVLYPFTPGSLLDNKKFIDTHLSKWRKSAHSDTIFANYLARAGDAEKAIERIKKAHGAYSKLNLK